MQTNYSNFDKYEDILVNNHIWNPKIERMKVYLYLFAQLIYISGVATLIYYTELGYYLISDKLIFPIVFTITGLMTITTQSLLLYYQSNLVEIKPFLGGFFLLLNGFFVAYFWFVLQGSQNTNLFYRYQNPYILLGNIGIVLILFIILPQAYQKQRWISVLTLPTIINFILGFFYYSLDLNLQIQLYLFCIACLYMTEQDQDMGGEFYLSINIFGFITLFVIKAAVYLFKSFQNQNTQFVAQLQEQIQAQFIFLTYIIAVISTLQNFYIFKLTPQFNQLFTLYDWNFFCHNDGKREYNINPGFWIMWILNFFLFMLLFQAHRSLEFKYKTILAIVYLIFHQLSITGFYFVILCTREPYYFIYYYYLIYLKIQFLVGAITLQIGQQQSVKSMCHVLLLVPIFFNFMLVFDNIQCRVSDILLIIIINTFLIIYLGQLLTQNNNLVKLLINQFLQFKEDEYLISGALFSDPIALFVYQSIFLHAKLIKS